MKNVINSFEGKYRFLSNFHNSLMEVDDESYKTMEHAFQTAKTNDLVEKSQIRNSGTPGESKRLGRQCTLVHDWEKIKIDVMKKLLNIKFNNEILFNKLLDTESMMLVEGNT